MPKRREQHHADVKFGPAAMVPMDETGWLLTVNRCIQSAFDPSNPTWMPSDSFKWVSTIIDAAAPAGSPIRALHLGGAAMTLPRYITHTRPGSSQTVVEIDEKLIDFVTEIAPVPDTAGIDITIADARQVLPTLDDESFDLIIGDAYEGTELPASMERDGYARQISRVLKPDGLYAQNIFDSLDLRNAVLQTDVLDAVFPDWRIVAGHEDIAYMRGVNVVCAASNRPGGVPLTKIAAAGKAKNLGLLLLPPHARAGYFEDLRVQAAAR